MIKDKDYYMHRIFNPVVKQRIRRRSMLLISRPMNIWKLIFVSSSLSQMINEVCCSFSYFFFTSFICSSMASWRKQFLLRMWQSCISYQSLEIFSNSYVVFSIAIKFTLWIPTRVSRSRREGNGDCRKLHNKEFLSLYTIHLTYSDH